MAAVLYVCPFAEKEVSGGAVGREINSQLITELNSEIYVYRIDVNCSYILKIIYVILGYKNGLNIFHIRNIIKNIREKNIDVVFVDTSLYGILIEKLHKKMAAHIKIIAFFHNCEYKLYNDCYKNYSYFIKSMILRSVQKNEKKTLQYSSTNVFLNPRDYETCHKNYGIYGNSIVYSPIALNDRFNGSGGKYLPILFEPFNLLFVGSYFRPNINGLLWFEKNVLPYVDYKLTIVGSGFNDKDFIKMLSSKEKIILRGFVQDLDKEYENADIVIQPVFEGSGMKTKTAECLMYGKVLISTSEGLVGYEINGIDGIYCCDTADAFIDTLIRLKDEKISRFNPEIRSLFLEKYSVDSRKKIFSSLFKS